LSVIAILIPAVQRVRAAAAQARCGNQLGLASHSVHNIHKRMPHAFGFFPGDSITSGGNGLGTVFFHLLPPSGAHVLGQHVLGSCWNVSEPTIQHEPRDWSRRACRDAFELFDNVLAARLHSGNAVQHLDELARPIRFVSKELGKQLAVAQPLG
jgi:hypothetical protein